MNKQNIVIVGGGYAGVLTAKKLIKKLKKEIKNGEVELTLIDRQPYHTLMTELHEAAFDRTNSEAIKVYHKKIFNQKYINLKLANVESIDYTGKTIETDNGTVNYDYLVEATGAKVTHFGIEGAEENTIPMWSFDDTRVAMAKVLELFDRAEKTSNPEMRKELLTFVVAGAGFTGVEVAGELKEWIDRTLLYKYPTIKPSEVSMHVIDGAERILNSFSEKPAAKAHKFMEEKLGMNIILNSFITKVEESEVYFGEGQSIKSHCILWTSGITCEPISGETHDLQRGRIPVTNQLETEGKEGAYVLGDIMFYIPEGEERPVPQMVENCEHAAPIVANNIACKIKGDEDKAKAYSPAFHGAMACIGGRYGVAELLFAGRSMMLTGFFAMFVKHMINVIYLLQATSLGKVWHYIRVEFFEVRDRRSFVGGNLAAQTPSIYLVPLRIWLGWYWMSSGAPKIIEKIQGGWEAVCVNTEIFPADVKNYGEVCRNVYPQGEAAFNAANGIGGDAVASASTAADTASSAVSSAVDAVSSVASTASDAVASASTAVADTASTVASSAADASHGFLSTIDGFFAAFAPTSTPFGMGYDLNVLIPDFIQVPLHDFMFSSVQAISGMEWLMELVFDFAEFALGALILIGFFTEFAAIGLLILSVMISAGSWMSYDGIVVLGLLFSICAAIPMIGLGGKDSMPISVDYFVRPWFRKR
ncbi:MAG: FAD-dependent oxidoreductase, partial [Vibrio fluvialis]